MSAIDYDAARLGHTKVWVQRNIGRSSTVPVDNFVGKWRYKRVRRASAGALLVLLNK